MQTVPCPECNGCGQVEIMIDRIEWYDITEEMTCPRCEGSGIVELVQNANGEYVGFIK